MQSVTTAAPADGDVIAVIGFELLVSIQREEGSAGLTSRRMKL